MANKIKIKAKTPLFDLKLKEVFKYKDLIWLFFKRNYSTRYKQTILGPAWLIISPLLTIFCYTILFGKMAGLSTDGIPQPLFYLSGTIFWSFFTDCFNSTCNTFTANSGILGKVYFPRLVIPISNLITSFFDFLIRLCLIFIFILYYFCNGIELFLTWKIIFILLYLLQVGLLAMSVGIIISAITIKYKDLQILVGFGMQLWMYATPIIYTTSFVPEKYKFFFMLNPVTPATLMFKNSFFGTEILPFKYFSFSCIITLFLFFAGIIIFNQAEKNFMDTV